MEHRQDHRAPLKERRASDLAGEQTTPFDAADPTLDAVRLMMEAEMRQKVDDPARATPEAASERASDELPAVKKLSRRFAKKADAPGKGPGIFPELDPGSAAPQETTEAVQASETQSVGTALVARLRQYHPSRKLSVFIAIVAVMIWRPWLLPGLLFLTLWIALIVYLTVGPDRLAELITPLRARLAARYPDKAAEIRRRAQIGADRVEALLEKLPARWREGIYLPDLGRSGDDIAGLESRPDPFERLTAERDREIDQDLGRA